MLRQRRRCLVLSQFILYRNIEGSPRTDNVEENSFFDIRLRRQSNERIHIGYRGIIHPLDDVSCFDAGDRQHPFHLDDRNAGLIGG